MKNFSRRTKIIFAIVISLLLVGLLLLSHQEVAPTIAETSPSDGAQNIATNTTVSLRFSEILTPKQQGKIEAHIEPSVPLSTNWLPTGQTIELSVLDELTPSTLYILTITYQQKNISEFSFTTAKYSQAELRKQADDQTSDDRLFAKQQQEIFTQYPWYNQLPLITTEYEIFYNFTKSKFNIVLKGADKDLSLEKAKTAITNLLGKPVTSNDFYTSQ